MAIVAALCVDVALLVLLGRWLEFTGGWVWAVLSTFSVGILSAYLWMRDQGRAAWEWAAYAVLGTILALMFIWVDCGAIRLSGMGAACAISSPGFSLLLTLAAGAYAIASAGLCVMRAVLGLAAGKCMTTVP